MDDDDEDDGDGKTAAFSLDDMGDLLKDPAPAPARAAAPAPMDDDDEDDGEGKTAAFSLDDMGDLLKEPAPAPAPAKPAKPAPEPMAEEFERTQAVNLDDFEMATAEANKTLLVDDDLGPPSRSKKAAPAPAPEPATLTVVVGNDVNKVFKLTGDVTLVGRGMDADFVINDASASRRHFNVVRTSSGYKLVDLGSGNGTKVDGHRVQEIALATGMTIECGTTTLEFGDPSGAAAPVRGGGGGGGGGGGAYRDFDDDDGAEKTRMGDMAALEIDPDWESRRSRMRQEEQQGFETTAEPAVEERAPVKKKGGAGKMIAIIGGLVVLGGGGFVAADKFGGLGIIFPKEASVTSTNSGDGSNGGTETGEAGTTTGQTGEAGATADAKKKAQDLVLEGEAAYVDKRWYEAKKFFKEALELDPKAERGNGDPVDEAVVLVDAQLEAWNALVDAKKAASEERFNDALELLRKIKVSTAYHKDAQEMIPTVRDDFVAKSLGMAREAEEKGDYEGAKKAVEAALAVSKEDADALAMQVALTRATAPDADNLETDDEDPEKRVQPTKVAKIDFAPGFAKYAASDFMGAIDFFDGITYGKASRRDKAKAKAVAGAITKLDTVLRAGQEALAAGKLDKALEDLRLAKKYDQAVNGAFQSKISKDLGKAYAAKAKAAFDANDLTGAGSLAKKALANDPGNAEASAMMGDVQKTAKSWLADAKAAAGDNPDKAMKLLAKALNVLPVDDPAYKEAYALLNKLGQEIDE
ncbi:MAG: FHA domain-containing protein [Deltaproteobacteria bacterium]|nr:MAG: FHA domain-containing protein [Deltaproteobacteria bacterium]